MVVSHLLRGVETCLIRDATVILKIPKTSKITPKLTHFTHQNNAKSTKTSPTIPGWKHKCGRTNSSGRIVSILD